jgi:hypothetical protein
MKLNKTPDMLNILHNLQQVHFQLEIQSKDNSSFGTEDSQVLKSIFQKYDQFLTPRAKQRNTFIGKIKRCVLLNTSSTLETLDVISVYQRVLTMMGNTLPYVTKYSVKTTWQDGIPTRMTLTDQDTCIGVTTCLVFVTMYPFEQSSVTAEVIHESYTDYLYCLPKFSCNTSCDFQYHLDNQDLEVGFGDAMSKCIQRSFGFLNSKIKRVEFDDPEVPIRVEERQDDRSDCEENDSDESPEPNFKKYTIDMFMHSPLGSDEDINFQNDDDVEDDADEFDWEDAYEFDEIEEDEPHSRGIEVQSSV